MKILIVKLSSIGDVVHTLPAAAALRRAFPGAEISWAVERGASEMLRNCPVLDRPVVIDIKAVRSAKRAKDSLRELGRKYRELRGHGFDVAIDFQGLIKSALVAKLSGARTVVGFSEPHLRERASSFFLDRQVDVPENSHVILRNIFLAEEALGFKADLQRLEFPVSLTAEETAGADRILSAVQGEFALINPGGGWPTKLWPAENFGRLADMIAEGTGLTPVIVTAPKESRLAEGAKSADRGGRTVFIKPGLRELYEIARRAKVYIGGDTGPTHIAVAAGTPVVGIFGPTEWWRNGSPREADICVERNDIGCRVNCHRRSCSKWICLDIEPSRVFDAVVRRLADA